MFFDLIGACGGRKFLVTLLSALLVALGSKIGLTQQDALTIAGIAASYIIGQGVSDGMTKGITSSTPGTPVSSSATM